MSAATRTLAGAGDLEELSTALRAHAEGGLCAEAAVELLIEHHCWLVRADFVRRFVDVFDAMNGMAMALVDWTGAVDALASGDLACSSSEGQVLRLAASIAEEVPVVLGEAMCGLDATNAARVARALMLAADHSMDIRIEGEHV